MYLKALLRCFASVFTASFSVSQKDGIIKAVAKERINMTTTNSMKVKPSRRVRGFEDSRIHPDYSGRILDHFFYRSQFVISASYSLPPGAPSAP